MENAQFLEETLRRLDAVGGEALHSTKTGHPPRRTRAIAVLKDIMALLFPGYFPLQEPGEVTLPALARISRVREGLREQIEAAFSYDCCGRQGDGERLADAFIASLPRVKETLYTDIEALYEGDPAARCREEVLICYPGFYAVAIYRVAHVLYDLDVPFLPRILTEYAHEKTGIDIHAGARIGEYFFIDHGTGIVIGETTTIGDHVKLYQGVTLGAKSFELDENGNPVKGIKRHPDIGSRVVIYANATILGGTTRIGDDCTIGGNVWLTSSVPAGQTVYFSPHNSTPAEK